MYGKKPVPVLNTGPQRNRPYKQLIYTACNYAIPCQARERDSCNTYDTVILPLLFIHANTPACPVHQRILPFL